MEKRTKTLPGGASFSYICETEPHDHFTHFCFVDEEGVRARWWYPNIKPGQVVLDVGALVGSYALAAVALGAEKVLAWCPERLAWLMNRNVETNPGYYKHLEVLDYGAWSRKGYVEVMEHAPMPRFYERLPDEMLYGQVPTPNNIIPVLPVDTTVLEQHKLERVDVMKIDTEGAELEVLKGAEQTLRRFRPMLMVENHLFKRTSIADECAEYITGLGLGYREAGRVPYHAISHSLYIPE